MHYRKFGRTGWQVSEIAFGAWQLGGTWGKVDDQESIRTLHAAFDMGINFVDTAQAYGAGRSEEVIGRALEARQANDKIYVTSKIGALGADHATAGLHSMKGRYPTWYLKREVENSLRRLKVDCLDLLQLHLWLPGGMECFDWLEALTELVKEGKIEYFGVSLPDIRPETGIELAKSGLVTSQQLIYNIFEQAPEEELFPHAERHDTAIIARVPFDSGALTGAWNDDTYNNWSEGDKRKSMYRNGRFEDTLKRVKEIEALCKGKYDQLSEAAIRFSLSNKAVSTVLCGMRNEEELRMNCAYSDGESFPEDLKEKLKEHNWRHQFYS